MRHALESWTEIEKQMKDTHPVLFLDYDGTLTPIVEDPEKADLPPDVKNCLAELQDLPDISVVLISGRSIASLKEKTGLKKMTYVGNHGLELEGPKIAHVHPEARDRKVLLLTIQKRLAEKMKACNGVRIENKTYSLSVHYRGVPQDEVEAARKLFMEVVTPYVESSCIAICEGKKVWEVRPGTGWNKGSMVLWLMVREMVRYPKKTLPIYIGDDTTDEDALLILKDKGIGIRVTENPKEPSHAVYFLKHTGEVLLFLNKMKQWLRLNQRPKTSLLRGFYGF